MTAIIEMLNRLAEIAPDVCKMISPPDFKPHYQIGEYEFWQHSLYGFMANRVGGNSVDGRPALSWLRDALEGEIEKHGWNWREEKLGKYCAALYRGQAWRLSDAVEGDVATALLAAFLAAVEGKK